MHDVWEGVRWALGLGAEPMNLTFLQMALRTIVMYVAGATVIRLAGDRRFGGRYTVYDIVLGFTFGSLMSRAINGSSPFWVTIGAGFVLVVMNRLFAFLGSRSSRFSQLISGKSLVLIQDGEIQWDNMNKSHVSQQHLLSSLRNNAHLSEPQEVKVARFERNGQISIIPQKREPQVIEVNVEDGVQTVRVQLDYAAKGEMY